MTLKAALQYAAGGFAVIPLHDVTSGVCSCPSGAECRSAGKHPRISEWQKQATTSADIIREWWAQWPSANVGVATGAASDIVVLDVDGAEGAASLAQLEAQHGALPVTLEARTGSGGRHLVFSYPAHGVSNSASKIAPGLDVRGDGGQIVAAPSVTLKGPYAWVDESADIADAPVWLFPATVPNAVPQGPRLPFPPATADDIARAREALDEHGPAIQGQGGDAHTWQAAAKARVDHALTFEEAWPLFVEWNATCQPPWNEKELRSKLEGGDRYGSGQYGASRQLTPVQRTEQLIEAWKASGSQDPEALLRPAREVPLSDVSQWERCSDLLRAATGLRTVAAIGLPKYRKPIARVVTPVVDGEALELARNTQGAAYASLDNVMRVLVASKREIAWDEFEQRVIGAEREWNDADTYDLTLDVQRTYGVQTMKSNTTREAVELYARRHAFDSARDWLTGLEWDGTPRIHTLWTRGFGAEENENTTAAGANFVKSLASRILDPGSKVDTMPVLEGSQGKLKSSGCKALVGTKWFAESSGDIHSKDYFAALQGKLVIEVAELDSFARADVNAIKRMLTCQVDRFRPPYGRYAQDFPRRSVFVGTTNKDDWHRDETGGRRFWPIRVGEIDIDWIEANREQLFAEAASRVAAGEPWWVMPVERTAAEVEERLQVDPWAEILAPWLAGKLEVTAGDVFTLADSPLCMAADRIDKRQESRLGLVLRHLGWEPRRERVNGRQVRIYSPN